MRYTSRLQIQETSHPFNGKHKYDILITSPQFSLQCSMYINIHRAPATEQTECQAFSPVVRICSPAPSTASYCPLCFGGGGTHSLAEEGAGSQFGRRDRHSGSPGLVRCLPSFAKKKILFLCMKSLSRKKLLVSLQVHLVLRSHFSQSVTLQQKAKYSITIRDVQFNLTSL